MSILEARGMGISYGRRQVVHDVDLALGSKATVGLIGESGSGKTTILRAMLGLLPISSGELLFEGESLASMSRAARKRFRASVQPVFQDGNEALNPRFSVDTILREGLAARSGETDAPAYTVSKLLEEVGLDASLRGRRPHELSGGQRQRVAIARALAVGARYLVLDEPTSALDVSIQGRIIALLQRLAVENDLGYLLISHNLGVVRALCTESYVLRDGRVVEHALTAQLLDEPEEEYTRRLRDSMPRFPDEITRIWQTEGLSVAEWEA